MQDPLGALIGKPWSNTLKILKGNLKERHGFAAIPTYNCLMNKFINALFFQLGWCVCVLSVSRNLEWPAIVFCLLLVLLHLFAHPLPQRSKDLQLMLLGLPIGIAADTCVQAFNIMGFYGWAIHFLSPFWLWMVWILFLLTLNHSLSFLKHIPMALTALLGLIFGTLSYIAGAKLGAASFDGDPVNLLIIALQWSILLPSLVGISKWRGRILMY